MHVTNKIPQFSESTRVWQGHTAGEPRKKVKRQTDTNSISISGHKPKQARNRIDQPQYLRAKWSRWPALAAPHLEPMACWHKGRSKVSCTCSEWPEIHWRRRSRKAHIAVAATNLKETALLRFQVRWVDRREQAYFFEQLSSTERGRIYRQNPVYPSDNCKNLNAYLHKSRSWCWSKKRWNGNAAHRVCCKLSAAHVRYRLKLFSFMECNYMQFLMSIISSTKIYILY